MTKLTTFLFASLHVKTGVVIVNHGLIILHQHCFWKPQTFTVFQKSRRIFSCPSNATQQGSKQRGVNLWKCTSYCLTRRTVTCVSAAHEESETQSHCVLRNMDFWKSFKILLLWFKVHFKSIEILYCTDTSETQTERLFNHVTRHLFF